MQQSLKRLLKIAHKMDETVSELRHTIAEASTLLDTRYSRIRKDASILSENTHALIYDLEEITKEKNNEY